MINTLIFNSTISLTAYIEKDPGFIVGPITAFLGYILNFLFDIAYNFTITNSLGIAIILLTIVARTLMLPIAFKQQKSMVAMRRVQPEIERIKAKYGTTKDPELQRKMNAEVQTAYAKNNANPLIGCIPMLITLPIFFALSALMRHSYVYIDVLGNVYDGISNILTNDSFFEVLAPLANSKIQANSGLSLDLGLVSDISKALSRFTGEDWTTLVAGIQTISSDTAQTVTDLLKQKQQIESFIGIDLTAATGWGFPNVILPVLTGLTTFLSTWIMNKQQAETTDPAMKSQQTIMLVVMPIMMTWMTTSLSAGVGIYWIVSSVYQTIQQVVLNNYYTKNGAELVIDSDEKQPKEIIVLDKSRNKKKGEK